MVGSSNGACEGGGCSDFVGLVDRRAMRPSFVEGSALKESEVVHGELYRNSGST